jgi:hypothetical protein
MALLFLIAFELRTRVATKKLRIFGVKKRKSAFSVGRAGL